MIDLYSCQLPMDTRCRSWLRNWRSPIGSSAPLRAPRTPRLFGRARCGSGRGQVAPPLSVSAHINPSMVATVAVRGRRVGARGASCSPRRARLCSPYGRALHPSSSDRAGLRVTRLGAARGRTRHVPRLGTAGR
jgi:hypothetical protein